MICRDCNQETGHYAKHSASNPACRKQSTFCGAPVFDSWCDLDPGHEGEYHRAYNAARWQKLGVSLR